MNCDFRLVIFSEGYLSDTRQIKDVVVRITHFFFNNFDVNIQVRYEERNREPEIA